jgi:hypothetical protein
VLLALALDFLLDGRFDELADCSAWQARQEVVQPVIARVIGRKNNFYSLDFPGATLLALVAGFVFQVLVRHVSLPVRVYRKSRLTLLLVFRKAWL